MKAGYNEILTFFVIKMLSLSKMAALNSRIVLDEDEGKIGFDTRKNLLI